MFPTWESKTKQPVLKIELRIFKKNAVLNPDVGVLGAELWCCRVLVQVMVELQYFARDARTRYGWRK